MNVNKLAAISFSFAAILPADTILLCTLAVWQRILLYLLSDGSRVSRLWLRWILSFKVFWAGTNKKYIEVKENTLGFYKQAALQYVRIHRPFSRLFNLCDCPPFSRCPDLCCVVQNPLTLEQLTASTHLKPRSEAVPVCHRRHGGAKLISVLGRDIEQAKLCSIMGISNCNL